VSRAPVAMAYRLAFAAHSMSTKNTLSSMSSNTTALATSHATMIQEFAPAMAGKS
jgi:hypothetical protein